MFAHPKSRLILRTGALVGLLALTPLAFTAGGELGTERRVCRPREPETSAAPSGTPCARSAARLTSTTT